MLFHVLNPCRIFAVYAHTHTHTPASARSRSNFLLNFIAQVESNVRSIQIWFVASILYEMASTMWTEWLQHCNINEYTLVKSVIQLFVHIVYVCALFPDQSFRWIKLLTHNPISKISKITIYTISSCVWMNFVIPSSFFIFQITNYARNYIHLLCFLFRIFILLHGFITIFLVRYSVGCAVAH